MAISYLGRLTGANYSGNSPNLKYVSKITVPAGGVYAGMGFLHANMSSSTGYYKFVIYDDLNGEPNNLIYEGGEQIAPSQILPLYWNLNYLYLSAGDYYIGCLSSGLYTRYKVEDNSGINFKNTDTYSDGASDPFGIPDDPAPVDEIVAAIYYVTGNEIGIVKTVGYAVLSTEQNVVVAKVVGFAVLAPFVEIPSTSKPFSFVIT